LDLNFQLVQIVYASIPLNDPEFCKLRMRYANAKGEKKMCHPIITSFPFLNCLSHFWLPASWRRRCGGAIALHGISCIPTQCSFYLCQLHCWNTGVSTTMGRGWKEKERTDGHPFTPYYDHHLLLLLNYPSSRRPTRLHSWGNDNNQTRKGILTSNTLLNTNHLFALLRSLVGHLNRMFRIQRKWSARIPIPDVIDLIVPTRRLFLLHYCQVLVVLVISTRGPVGVDKCCGKMPWQTTVRDLRVTLIQESRRIVLRTGNGVSNQWTKVQKFVRESKFSSNSR